MPNQIQLQSDIGTLGIHGLGAFSTVLATLSADNIAPMALIQMEKLGASFKVSGQFAARVPDLLRRFTAQPLGRLAVAIGWRKGDSASLLAETAGGQAVALLSILLSNFFKKHQCGEILSQLCSRLLSSEFSVASVLQLADITDLLAQKLFPLGFGNFLPEQVVKIHHAYRSLDIEPPIDLLESLTVDATVDLLYAISQALRDKAKIIRISGSFAMGHILGLLLFMFPHDTVVTIEDVVIHEGERQSIHVELRKDPPGPVTITIENTVNKSAPFYSSIKIESQRSTDLHTQYQFAWSGWIAKGMELAFLEAGSVCTQDVLTAFCNLLVAMLNTRANGALYLSQNSLPGNQLSGLLGSHGLLKMERICQEILFTTPSSYDLDPRSAFLEFVEFVEATISLARICSCTGTKCAFANGWIEARDKSKRMCKAHRMWAKVGRLLGIGLLCFFINARPNATVDFITTRLQHNVAQDIIQRNSLANRAYYLSTQSIYLEIMRMIDKSSPELALASSYGSTIYPTVLETLQLPFSPLASFELLDGKLIFEERYYETLSSASTAPRPKAKKSIVRERGGIKPSSIGEHKSLLMTVRETASCLEVRTTARYAGTNVHLGLSGIIQASFSLERTSACSHPLTNLLKDTSHEVVLTSIEAPWSSKRGSIAIAMTQSNPTAQLLCCEPGARMILMQDCCLDCALKQAASGSFNMILVS